MKGFIFDVDGTLVDSNDQHAHAFVEAFQKVGESVSYQMVRRLIGMGSDKLIPKALGRDVAEAKVKEIDEIKGGIFRRKYLSTVKPFAGVRELFAYLKDADVRIAIATSGGESDLKTLLGLAKIDDLVKLTVTSDDAQNSKPSPDIVLAAKEKMELPDNAMRMVGDTPYDLLAAKRAGLKSWAVLTGGWKSEELGEAERMFAGPAAMLVELQNGGSAE